VYRLRRAFELSASDWFLVLHAAFWFAVVELGMRAFQFSALVDFLHQESQPDQKAFTQRSSSAERAAYCVELVSRLHPLHPTCLKKALVLYALLTRRGFDARVYIGAAKTNTEKGSELDYHAWLEHQGQVILGGQGQERYATLCCLDRFERVARGEGQVAS
jgi:Transglutaminase-like superfamily